MQKEAAAENSIFVWKRLSASVDDKERSRCSPHTCLLFQLSFTFLKFCLVFASFLENGLFFFLFFPPAFYQEKSDYKADIEIFKKWGKCARGREHYILIFIRASSQNGQEAKLDILKSSRIFGTG